MLTIRLVTDRDIIYRSCYLSDIVRKIILLLFGDTSPIRDEVAREYYYIIIVTHHRPHSKWRDPLYTMLNLWSLTTNHVVNRQSIKRMARFVLITFSNTNQNLMDGIICLKANDILILAMLILVHFA